MWKIKFNFVAIVPLSTKQGRKRPLDTPKRMIERREREGKREKIGILAYPKRRILGNE